MEIEYTLTRDKITKGAVRYSDGEGHSLYFRKEELKEPYPKKISIKVTNVIE